jgi:hypothetical protein
LTTETPKMANPDPNRVRFREAAQPWERIYIAFFVGMFITAIVAVPVALYGLEALENNLRLIGAVALTMLLTVAFGFGLVFVLRRRIAAWFGLPPPGLLRDVYDPAVAGIEALRKARLDEAYLEFKSAAAAAVSFYAWLTIRWWMVSTSIALIGVFATVAGTALLFRHNELLFDQNNLYVDQNRKINEQNRRLRVQNKLLYVQTDVEVRSRFAAQRERLRELQRTAAEVRRQRSRLADKTVRVRTCGATGKCSEWRSVEWDADPCQSVDLPKDAECSAVGTETIRKFVENSGKWSPDHEYAHRALEVLKYVSAATAVEGDTLEKHLDKCGVQLETSEALIEDLQRRAEIAAVVAQLLVVHEPKTDESLLGLNRVTIGELARQFRSTQSRILQTLDTVAAQCAARFEKDQRRLEEAERQHDALADEVLQ